MMLLDEVLTDFILSLERAPDEIRDATRFICEGHRSAIIFRIDNVVDYLLRFPKSLPLLEDFPCLAPPYPDIWLEAVGIPGELRSAVWIHYEEIFDKPPAKWAMIIIPWWKLGRQLRTATAYWCVLTHAGRIVAFQRAKDPAVGGESAFLVCALFAIGLTNCGNVIRTDHIPRTNRRHGGKGHGRIYKTLEIDPMRKVLEAEGNAQRTGLKLALHICRGHFKHFDQHGLFGKYTGTYWWADHVRGSRERGEVVKQYWINATKDEAA